MDINTKARAELVWCALWAELDKAQAEYDALGRYRCGRRDLEDRIHELLRMLGELRERWNFVNPAIFAEMESEYV